MKTAMPRPDTRTQQKFLSKTHQFVKSTASRVAGRTSTFKAMRKLREELADEMRLLSRLRHPNIIAILGMCMEKGVIPLMVLEYLPLGSVFDLLHNCTMEVDSTITMPIARDIITGMSYLHGFLPAIVHADLKSANVLIDVNFRARLTDFGLTHRRSLGQAGTPYWMSPELLRMEHCTPTKESDVYAFGIVLFELITRQVPFAEVDYETAIASIIQASPPFRPTIPSYINAPAALVTLMHECWDEDFEARPSFMAIGEKFDRRRLASYNQSFNNNPGSAPKQIAAPSSILQISEKPDVCMAFATVMCQDALSSDKIQKAKDQARDSFHRHAALHGVEIVPTVDNSWLGVTNMNESQSDHTSRMIRFAMAVIGDTESLVDAVTQKQMCAIQFGLHVGSVIVGQSSSRDSPMLFGTTVATANRMETLSRPGRIRLSADAVRQLHKQEHVGIRVTKGMQNQEASYWAMAMDVANEHPLAAAVPPLEALLPSTLSRATLAKLLGQPRSRRNSVRSSRSYTSSRKSSRASNVYKK
eukprot:m.213516 g.213516  ORF g.213516 m.213516 type:complete len:530 (+) comp17177_c0_seq2:1882-3471(+)